MKPLRFLLTACVLLTSFSAFSQQLPPAVEWHKSLGGSGDDRAHGIIRTPDGGFVVVGYSKSNDGDVSGRHGALNVADGWIVKLDGTGNIEWQRSVGGTGRDELKSVVIAPDGSYMCMGITFSNDGDVSGNHGNGDIWLVNISRQGNINWQKCIGGSAAETPGNIRLINGYFYFIGHTGSNNGDVSGNHGGITDIWFVKIAPDGTIAKKMCLGGSLYDEGFDVAGAESGHFILAIESGSDDGNFGQMGGPTPRGGLVKIDSNGLMKWKRSFLRQEPRSLAKAGNTFFYGNYLLFCTPMLNNAGIVSGYINNVPGSSNAPSENTIATYGYCPSTITQPNWTYNISGPTALGSINNIDMIQAGFSDDPGGTIGTPKGMTDGWLIGGKAGNSVSWSKLIGGSGTDVLESVAIMDDNQFVVAGRSNSNNGDATGNHGDFDFWIVKLGKVSHIRGTVFMDYNLNGTKEASEPFVNNFLVESEKGSSKAGSLTFNGIFSNAVDTGTYTTKLINQYPYYTPVPASHNTTFAIYNITDSFNFAMQPIPGKRDYKINIFAVGAARPGFDITYHINYSNVGTDTLQNKPVKFIKDSRQVFLSAIPSPSAINGDTLTWNIGLLDPRQSGNIAVKLQNSPPPIINIGDTLKVTATIDNTGDLTPLNNMAYVRISATGSYDPNDKNESLGGTMLFSQVATQELTYTIRFQNTGNDTAFTIVIRDTLDTKLDYSSIEMVSASHNYVLNIKDGNKLTWTFDKILLVDSVHNEPASHGYITYRIKPKPALAVGEIIKNSASIYFDFNPPIKTNVHETEIKQAIRPPAPIVTGLQSPYCGQGVLTGKIANLPLASSGINVSVLFNTITPLTIAADSTFSYNLSGTLPGAYHLDVIFSNAAGADTLRYQIMIQPSVTPDVDLSASITTVVNLVDPVLITATEAAGGGDTPLYTFAKDRAFSIILQVESISKIVNIAPNTLQAGDNWIYVRMKTNATCYTTQYALDSIKITMQLPVPPQPVIGGLRNAYCKTEETQTGTVNNLPVNTGVTITVKLDGNSLGIATDYSFEFNPALMTAGAHVLEVMFSNPSGTKTTTFNFTVSAPVTPDVNVSTSMSTVDAAAVATITAANAAGGGNTPLYTFARDRDFTQVLQAEGSSTSYQATGQSLLLGNNWIYVRMKTSSTCYTVQTAIDSVMIVKTSATGLTDPDNPNARISTTPNPFKGYLMISGLSAAKSYTVVIYNLQGRQVSKTRIVNRTSANLHVPGYMAGTYMLSLYDETKKRMIGTLEIVKQ